MTIAFGVIQLVAIGVANAANQDAPNYDAVYEQVYQMAMQNKWPEKDAKERATSSAKAAVDFYSLVEKLGAIEQYRQCTATSGYNQWPMHSRAPPVGIVPMALAEFCGMAVLTAKVPTLRRGFE